MLAFPKPVRKLKPKRPISRGKGFSRPGAPSREREVKPTRATAVHPMARKAVMSRVTAAAVSQPKAEKAKPGKRTPTIEEARWMSAIVRRGCVACDLDQGPPRPAVAVHHILRGGQRIGHLFTLPLCDPGHHQNGQQFGMVSRHPWKARFEAKYGTEMELLMTLRAAIGGLA